MVLFNDTRSTHIISFYKSLCESFAIKDFPSNEFQLDFLQNIHMNKRRVYKTMAKNLKAVNKHILRSINDKKSNECYTTGHLFRHPDLDLQRLRENPIIVILTIESATA